MTNTLLAILIAIAIGNIVASRRNNKLLREILMKTDEAIAKLGEIKNQLTKVGQETAILLETIRELQAAATGDISDELKAAIEAVANQAQVVDDQVPDPEQIPGGEQQQEQQQQ